MQAEVGFPLVERPNGGWDERLRVFHGGDDDMVDTYALITERSVVLVDTMHTPELAAGIYAAITPLLGGRQLLVVNTHADYDHCWGNALFEQPGGPHPAPIIGHTLTAERLRGTTERAALARRQREDARFASVRLVPPTITFEQRLMIDGGDLTLELFHTPGHTPDHCAGWVPELRLALGGDATEYPIPLVRGAANLPILRDSLARLLALDAVLLLPCHGGTTDPNLPARNLAYLDQIERLARAALAAGRIPSDWATRDDLPELIGLPYAEMLRDAGADPAVTPAFYADFHQSAIRTTLAWLDA